MLAVAASFGAVLLALPRAGAAPIISEFMAENDDGLADVDGDFSDWIEIHNPDAAPVNLDGYYLTDEPEQMDLWRIPAVTLQPSQSIVIFASNKNRTNPAAQLHTNFRLNNSGEYLALVAPNRETILQSFAPFYPEQFPNTSYGLRGSTNDSERGYFSPATPGATNGNGFVFPLPSVQFSTTSKIFVDAFDLTLTGPNDPNVTIRYVMDRDPTTGNPITTTAARAVPTAASTAYTAPIRISKTTHVRARLVHSDGTLGPVTSHTFMETNPITLGFTSNLPIMVFYSYAVAPQSDTPREMFWMIFEPKPDPANPTAPPRAALNRLPDFVERGTAEIRGSSTSGDPKFQFSAETKDEFNFEKNTRPLGMRSESDWVMASPYNFDRALVRNPFIFDLSNKINRYAPRNKFCEIFFERNSDRKLQQVPEVTVASSDYFGVYSLTEKIKRGNNRVDIDALTPQDNTEPNVTGGYIFKVDRLDPGDSGFSAGGQSLAYVYPRERVTAATPLNPDPPAPATTQQKAYLRDEINRFKAAVDRSTAGFTHPTTGKRYDEYIDVEQWIDHWWLNNIMMNVDALRLSAYYHKPRGGKIAAGPIWDFDRAAGSTDGRDVSPTQWHGGGDATTFWTFPWWQQCFRDPDYYQRNLDRWFELRKGIFDVSFMNSYIDEMTAPLGEAAVRNFNRWTGVAPRTSRLSGSTITNIPANSPMLAKWQFEVLILKDWLARRAAWIDSQFPARPAFNQNGGRIQPGFPLTITAPDLLLRYTMTGSDPRAPGGGMSPHAFEVPGGLVIHRSIPAGATAKYVVPADDTLGTTWRQLGFNDTAWASGPMGLGFEVLNPQGLKQGGLWAAPILTDIQTQMLNVNPTAYVRVPFRFEGDVARVTRVVLRVKADDGYVAYLNETEIKATRKPATLTWNSASASAPNTDNVNPEITNATTLAKPVLRNGDNVLAVQMLNGSIANNDALLSVELDILETTPTGSISLNETTLVTARGFNPIAAPITTPTTAANPYPSPWSAPVKALFLVGEDRAATSNLVISEIMYHPPDATPAEQEAGFTNQDSFEFIELMNISPTETVNLYDASFVSGVDHPLNKGGKILRLLPGQRGVLVANREAFLLRYGSGALILDEYDEDQFDNGGERVRLNTFDGSAIRDFTFDDAAPWPEAADGDGPSLVLLTPLTSPDHDVPANWSDSNFVGGTPGTGDLSFAAWRLLKGVNGGRDDDDDGDGETNFQEYAAGTDPKSAASVASDSGYGVALEGGRVTIRVPVNRDAGDVKHTVQLSTDLVSWAPASSIEFLREERQGGRTLAVYRVATNAGPVGYLRARYFTR
ncbi:MAG: CotH kinase family protein [Verrucomicrobiales bacterium]